MTPSVDERVVQLVLATIGLAAFTLLLVERYRVHRLERRDMSRLLLIDGLLVIVGIELVADALHEFGLVEPWGDAAQAVAFAARGALVAGGIALAATLEWVRA